MAIRETDAHGGRDIPEYGLRGKTLVFDRERQRQVMWIVGVVVLPIGAEVELMEPNVNAEVVGVRLLAATKSDPAAVCLDVRVPAEYWGEDSRPPVAP